MTLHKSKANLGSSLDDFLKEEGIYENTNSTAIRRVQNYHLEMGNELNTSAESIRFENDSLWVELADGRTIGVPLAWFPRLMNADACGTINVVHKPQLTVRMVGLNVLATNRVLQTANEQSSCQIVAAIGFCTERALE